MGCGVFSLYILSVLSTVLAAPADRNISSSTGEITFQTANNVYLTQNFPSLNSKCPCLKNQTGPPVAQLPDKGDADSREIKQMLSTVLETQRDLRNKFEILSEAGEGKAHVLNETFNSMNIRLMRIDGKLQAVQGHIGKTGRTLHEIQNKSRADTEEMVAVLSNLLETQHAIRTQLHSLSEVEEEKTERHNETLLSLNARLVSIEIQNNETGKHLKEIQHKLEYLYNQSARINLIEVMETVGRRVNEEQDRKLDQIIDLISNISNYLYPLIHCAARGICLDSNGKYPIEPAEATNLMPTTTSMPAVTSETSQLTEVTPTDKPCPNGFRYRLVTEAYTSCYKFVLDWKRSWNDSRDYCKRLGGDLVSIETKDEMDHLTSIATSDPSLLHPQASAFWCSGTDLDVEGTWRWTTGGLVNRSLPQVDLLIHGDKEDCLHVNWTPSSSYFGDWYCTNTQFPLCEVRLV